MKNIELYFKFSYVLWDRFESINQARGMTNKTQNKRFQGRKCSLGQFVIMTTKSVGGVPLVGGAGNTIHTTGRTTPSRG
jgi:hypothetical protein